MRAETGARAPPLHALLPPRWEQIPWRKLAAGVAARVLVALRETPAQTCEVFGMLMDAAAAVEAEGLRGTLAQDCVWVALMTARLCERVMDARIAQPTGVRTRRCVLAHVRRRAVLGSAHTQSRARYLRAAVRREAAWQAAAMSAGVKAWEDAVVVATRAPLGRRAPRKTRERDAALGMAALIARAAMSPADVPLPPSVAAVVAAAAGCPQGRRALWCAMAAASHHTRLLLLRTAAPTLAELWVDVPTVVRACLAAGADAGDALDALAHTPDGSIVPEDRARWLAAAALEFAMVVAPSHCGRLMWLDAHVGAHVDLGEVCVQWLAAHGTDGASPATLTSLVRKGCHELVRHVAWDQATQDDVCDRWEAGMPIHVSDGKFPYPEYVRGRAGRGSLPAWPGACAQERLRCAWVCAVEAGLSRTAAHGAAAARQLLTIILARQWAPDFGPWHRNRSQLHWPRNDTWSHHHPLWAQAWRAATSELVGCWTAVTGASPQWDWVLDLHPAVDLVWSDRTVASLGELYAHLAGPGARTPLGGWTPARCAAAPPTASLAHEALLGTALLDMVDATCSARDARSGRLLYAELLPAGDGTSSATAWLAAAVQAGWHHVPALQRRLVLAASYLGHDVVQQPPWAVLPTVVEPRHWTVPQVQAHLARDDPRTLVRALEALEWPALAADPYAWAAVPGPHPHILPPRQSEGAWSQEVCDAAAAAWTRVVGQWKQRQGARVLPVPWALDLMRLTVLAPTHAASLSTVMRDVDLPTARMRKRWRRLHA